MKIPYESPKIKSMSGIFLLTSAVLALIFDNTPWKNYYETFFNFPFNVQLGPLQLCLSLLLWINSGLMTVFFLLVGLEIKREIFDDKFTILSKTLLPVLAGLGGILIPSVIYIAFNRKNVFSLRGWAIPTTTDIAFSSGILSLIGNHRLPANLRTFLTTLAVFDDLGAIIIISVFYTRCISLIFLSSAGLFLGFLVLLNRLRITTTTVYILVGIPLWICVLKSGVHPTLVGIALAFAIPIRDWKDPRVSPSRNLEYTLYPLVIFGVLPIFAFANAGVSFAGIGLNTFFSPITLGIALGLFLGKQIGIWLVCWIVLKVSRWTQIVSYYSSGSGGNWWRSLYGLSVIAGVGFTMSLFIGNIAFYGIDKQNYFSMVRLGVIVGSSLSGIFGYLILCFTDSYRENCWKKI
ncbi:Na+/H+ antiporter NhaA [Coxiella endosymbiont of Amblyomma sculptum]|uniref:Na+/H+ antiporter NhaA n=1 Tax=Coxiella endosymbiont of Amblyomma sculptum TaxID=2487929 RepID=UPI001359CF0A|nr:Na+/H+ antiporter NhaA [Coxiella endosymbiont of Amblyomma sculptum]